MRTYKQKLPLQLFTVQEFTKRKCNRCSTGFKQGDPYRSIPKRTNIIYCEHCTGILASRGIEKIERPLTDNESYWMRHYDYKWLAGV